jgi:hypothetical protein
MEIQSNENIASTFGGTVAGQVADGMVEGSDGFQPDATNPENITPTPTSEGGNDDAEAKRKEFFKGMKKLGAERGKGDGSFPTAIMNVFDGVLAGTITYNPPAKGRAAKGVVTAPSDIDLAWDAYADGVKAGTKHEGQSLASNKSKFNQVGAWAAGPDIWEQADVRTEALEYRKSLIEQNGKIKGSKGKVKYHTIVDIMLRLSAIQRDPANADARLDAAKIQNAVLKSPAQAKALRDKAEAFLKVLKHAFSGDETNPPERTDDTIADAIKAVGALVESYLAEDREKELDEMQEKLRAAGRI